MGASGRSRQVTTCACGAGAEKPTRAVDFRDPRRAQRQIVEFSGRYPLDAVVGVDDDTVLLAALAAEALGLPHNSVQSVKAARYKDVIEVKGDDHRVLTSHLRGADGAWVHFMTAHYRRKR